MPKINHIRIIELSRADVPATLGADLEWVKSRGVDVERLHQDVVFSDPLSIPGSAPLVFVDGNMALSGRYPTREEMGIWMMFGVVSPSDSNSGGIRPCTL
jgi:hypothetical protein